MKKVNVMDNYSILKNINSPNDLKKLSNKSLKRLCFEIRKKILLTVSKNGGHLSSNLGVVELTVALEREFDLPCDKIVFDVGHQCYPHKLLTGRYKRFKTLRQKDGISGYPKPTESKYDTFIAGHASTSISVACGIARAKLLNHEKGFVIALIGDGALTGGMAYEALNNASNLSNLIIVLNCNDMSISKTVGGFSKYLSAMQSKQSYLSFRNSVNNILDKTPLVGDILKKQIIHSKSILKELIYGNNLFTDFGLSYLGPVNGHSLNDLHNAFNWAKNTECPSIIQVFTKKGKGFKKAENDPSYFHGVSSFNKQTKNVNDFSNEFGNILIDFAKTDKRICAITAAMRDGTGLDNFSHLYKDRFFDVGIAEEHAITFASGLANGGFLPVFAVYSTFLQRSYDQILHDASLSNSHIVLAVDRAGIVGEDGKTHQGIFDISFVSSIPNTTIFAPSTFSELKSCMFRALYETKGVVEVRYPKGTEPTNIGSFSVPAADFQLIGNNRDILVITYGRLTSEVIKARDELFKLGINITILKLCKIHPISESAVNIAMGYNKVFFFEEDSFKGGVCETFSSKLALSKFQGDFYYRSIVNEFINHKTINQAFVDLKLDYKSLSSFILKHSSSYKYLKS